MLIRNNKIYHLFPFIFTVLAYATGCTSTNKARNIFSRTNDETAIQRVLKAGEIHHYTITVNAGEFVHVRAHQNNIDLMAKVSDINGEWKEVFDQPTGELGAEDIYLFSNSYTTYKVEIYPVQKYADAGTYYFEIVRKSTASGKDKKWMAALVATQKADKLRTKNETRHQSIEQYLSALALWKQVKDDAQYARAMRSLGFVYIREKNYEKALETFNQVLPLWKKLGDIRSEGFTYLIIGRIYNLQKNSPKSLEYNLKSLEHWKSVQDADQETFVLMNVGNLYAGLGEKEKAVNFFEQALKKNQQSTRPSVKAVVVRDYATAMLTVGETERAIELYEQSILQWKLTANKPEEARTAVMLAAYFAEKKNGLKAFEHYNEALEIWKKLDDQGEIKKVQAAMNSLGK